MSGDTLTMSGSAPIQAPSGIRRWLLRPLLLAGLAVQTVAVGLAAAAPGDPALMPNMFRPESTPAHTIHELSMLVLAVTGLIFAVVFGLILYAIVRYRRRPDDDGGSRRRSTAARRSSSRGR